MLIAMEMKTICSLVIMCGVERVIPVGMRELESPVQYVSYLRISLTGVIGHGIIVLIEVP